jgi:exopolysaccharide biosynthesis WecB/TagA/CpsF family protein
MKIKEYLLSINILSRNGMKFAIDRQDVLSARLCTFLNPYSYLMLRAHSQVLDKFDVIGVDGISLCFFLRWAGVCDTPRLSFDMTSVAIDVFRYAEATNRRVFMVGSTRRCLDIATQHITQRFPRIRFCGTSHGFLDKAAEQTLIAEILHADADIVICGMGAVRQEQFLGALMASGWQGQGYSCGGFIHQIAKGKLDYYPNWINRFNLRWFFRMLDEPKLVKRYLIQYPIALFLLAKDAMRFHADGN